MANFIPKITYGSPTTTITLTLPPQGDPTNLRIQPNRRQSTSLSGSRQTLWNFNEETREINLTFLSPAQIAELRTFYEDHASKGLEFSYFESEDEAAFITVTLIGRDFRPQEIAKDLFEITLRFRRVL